VHQIEVSSVRPFIAFISPFAMLWVLIRSTFAGRMDAAGHEASPYSIDSVLAQQTPQQVQIKKTAKYLVT